MPEAITTSCAPLMTISLQSSPMSTLSQLDTVMFYADPRVTLEDPTTLRPLVDVTLSSIFTSVESSIFVSFRLTVGYTLT